MQEPASETTVHATALLGFCDLCQLPLSAGTPRNNTANVLTRDGREHIFCSQPCRWIFLREPERYAGHKDVVKRILCGEAPADFGRLLADYFQLPTGAGGRDVYAGGYEWLFSGRVPLG
jgi:toluene monooxygenase system protein A